MDVGDAQLTRSTAASALEAVVVGIGTSLEEEYL